MHDLNFEPGAPMSRGGISCMCLSFMEMSGYFLDGSTSMRTDYTENNQNRYAQAGIQKRFPSHFSTNH